MILQPLLHIHPSGSLKFCMYQLDLKILSERRGVSHLCVEQVL